MLPELGHFCLILALCLAGLQSILFCWRPSKISSLNFMRPLALGQVFFVLVSVLVLAFSFLIDDFSVQYVAHNSNSALPWYYKLTALWAAHEGSLLLWITISSCWILVVYLFSRNWQQQFATKVLAILGMVNLGFLALLLKSSNPFLRTMFDIPLDGADLNPLLQDFGMIIHPPILYMGYVGSAVAFAFAIAALLDGRLDQSWALLVRPWILSTWLFLTLGIALGSWWAYYELGWGGWWFWDPVENASFMPWLTTTALLHCIVITAKQGRFLRLALFLAITSFALSLLGTFLVRSGVLSSVHSFATDPERGIYILQFLAITIGGALFLYGVRAPVLNLPTQEPLKFYSQETAILGNNLLLLTAAGTILLGTLYPLIYDLLFAQKISVGPPYFNTVFVPLMLAMFALMLPAILPKPKLIVLTIVSSIFLAIIFLSCWFKFVVLNAAIGLSFAMAIIVSTVLAYIKRTTNNIGMAIAHIGLAITLIGVSVTPAYEIEKDLRLNFSDTIKIADYKISFVGVTIVDGSNYIGQRGEFVVSKADKKIATMMPEKRLYLAQELPMTETAILPGILQDIYIALGQQLGANVWSVRIYYKPFVRWIWLGALFMAAGAAYAMLSKKRILNAN